MKLWKFMVQRRLGFMRLCFQRNCYNFYWFLISFSQLLSKIIPFIPAKLKISPTWPGISQLSASLRTLRISVGTSATGAGFFRQRTPLVGETVQPPPLTLDRSDDSTAGATSSWGSYRWRRTLSPWIRNLVFCSIMIIIPSQGYHHFPYELCMITPTPPAISIKKKPPQPLRVKEVGQLDQKLNAKKHSNSTEILGTSPERCAHLTHAAKEGREYISHETLKARVAWNLRKPKKLSMPIYRLKPGKGSGTQVDHSNRWPKFWNDWRVVSPVSPLSNFLPGYRCFLFRDFRKPSTTTTCLESTFS